MLHGCIFFADFIYWFSEDIFPPVMPIAVLENRAYQYKLHIPQLDLWLVIDIAHVLRLRWSHEIDATQKTEQCVVTVHT